MPLTKIPNARQRYIYDQFMELYWKKGGIPPTIRELGVAVGLSSSNTIYNHLKTLERCGLLKYRGHRSPAYAPVEDVMDRVQKIKELCTEDGGQLAGNILAVLA